MFIVGQPIASTDKDTIDFGFTLPGTTIKRDSIIVTNTYCDTFEVKSITLVVLFSDTCGVQYIAGWYRKDLVT